MMLLFAGVDVQASGVPAALSLDYVMPWNSSRAMNSANGFWRGWLRRRGSLLPLVILSEAKNLSKCLVQNEKDNVHWK